MMHDKKCWISLDSYSEQRTETVLEFDLLNSRFQRCRLGRADERIFFVDTPHNTM